MKSHKEYLMIQLPDRVGFVNLMPRIEEILRKSGIREGLCPVKVSGSPRWP